MELDYRRHPLLVVDDEPDILNLFRYGYGDEFEILTADDAAKGLQLLENTDVSVIVADQRMPVMSGTEFLARSMDVRPDAVRIVLTGYTDIEALIRAVNSSRIYRYVTKPWVDDELRVTLRRAVEVFHLYRENARLVHELRDANQRLTMQNAYLRTAAGGEVETIVGESPAIREVLSLIGKVAAMPTTVLIEGETGTGKELVARAIHVASPRRDDLFVPVNCASLSEGILESELFGHRRGSFTGAHADRKGLFDVANGGTLFLDEISETSTTLQAKLLRVLQEGEVRPVGDDRAHAVDVRVIAATNRRLADEVAAGRFREDLYYRLRVFPIRVPPLRDRREDIPALARHLVGRVATQLKKPVGPPTDEAIAMLQAHLFQGNVRELANEIERAVILCEPGAPLTDDLLSEHIQEAASGEGQGLLHDRTEGFERDEITAALQRAGGVKTRAAEELGLTARGLAKKMRRLGM
ncbi:MAG: sigma-54-dependent Fis family transcriptional regulator [Deltaproteobacteria bacterium]|nr:sigma-54-dependent Fis family transcriptional regulator [Deltaproteobacteria bacterium]